MWQLNSTVYCSEFIVQFRYFSCVWNLVVLWLFRVLEHSLHLLYICQSQYKMQITVTASSSSCMAAICQCMLCCPCLKSLDPSTLHCWSCLDCLVISSQLINSTTNDLCTRPIFGFQSDVIAISQLLRHVILWQSMNMQYRYVYVWPSMNSMHMYDSM